MNLVAIDSAGLSQRKLVAGAEGASLPTTDAGADVGRNTAKHGFEVEAAFHRHIKDGGARERADAQRLAAHKADASHSLDPPPGYGAGFGEDIDGGSGTYHGNPHGVSLDRKRRTKTSDFDRTRIGRISNQEIGRPQADRIKRAADRHAQVLVAEAAEVLNGSHQTRRHDAH
jgi:hypothetical protein